MTRNFCPRIASSLSRGLFEVSDLRPFGQSVRPSNWRELKLSRIAFPNADSRSCWLFARSVGKTYGMSRTDTAGLNPPRKAAGIIVASMVPN